MAIKYHFFGKDCIIDRSLNNRADLIRNLHAKNFDFTDMLFVNQIHGNKVIMIDQKNKLYLKNNKADGLITNLKNTVIMVYTADCCPILLFSKKPEIIAIIHAGWKGAKLGIIESAISEIFNLAIKLGFQNFEIEAKIGPSIRQESYQVGPEFLSDFLLEDKNNQQFFINSKNPNYYMFDLVGYVKNKLKNSGVKNIEDSNIDTYSNHQSFFSYRRSHHLKETDCGRNVSAIMIE